MRIEVNEINIDYRDEGSGLPVVFVHAFPLNQTMWDDQVADLRHFCRTITLDLRGFGNSDVPPGPYSMDQMASDVLGLMAALEIEEAALVGLSMGGYVSLAFYRKYSGSVRAMMLADTRASADTHKARESRLNSAKKAETEGASAIADEMGPQLLGPSTLQHKPEIARRVRSMIEANSPAGIAAAQRAMAERMDSTYLLAGIDRPVLIAVGAEDSLTPVAEAEALRNGIPHSRMHVVPSAGHLSNLEQPAEFNRALGEFIRELQRGESTE
jgi:pimeloyl-ACP methyl ester carboxylesterase